MKKIFLRMSLLCMGAVLFFGFLKAGKAAGEPVINQEVIVILSTRAGGEMQAVRKIIEEKGGKLRNIFPPNIFIARLPVNVLESLKSLKINGFRMIEEISSGKVDLYYYRNYESSMIDVIKMWNKKFDRGEEIRINREDFMLLQQEVNNEISPDDIVTEQEKAIQNKEYLQRWLERKQRIESKQGKERSKTISGVSSFMADGSGGSGFGKAYGAGYNDTSLYLAGDIAVGIFFAKGSAGEWTEEDMNNSFEIICNELNQFIDDEPNADICFTYVKEIEENGVPKPLPSNQRDYINDLRNIYYTHWAFMIIVYNGTGGGADADPFGPAARFYSKEAVGAVRHETMHIFGANDQYESLAVKISPLVRSGYLKVVNANSEYNDGKGYFSGRGEAAADLMLRAGSKGPIGVYTRGQVGWRDSDGDGILDPLDTFPDTVVLNKTGNNPFTYTGKSVDMPLKSEIGALYSDVTLNTIKTVEYRINGGAWCEVEAVDGTFDSGEEEFIFVTPSFSAGRYKIEVRAVNSAGNTEVSCAKDEFEISASAITNVRPFAAFFITPLKGSIETEFIFNAGVSSDIEDDIFKLQFRWDFENDGRWDTGYSDNKTVSFKYAAAGRKIIRLEVKDTAGLTHTVTKQIDVADANIPPEAIFTVTPENQHGNYDSFSVALDAAGSWDGEDSRENLKLRWDFDDDGYWDTEYSDNRVIQHTYKLPFSPSLLAKFDNLGDASDVCISGNYAYVADGSNGLEVIDIKQPNNPVLAGSYDTPGDACGVYVLGNYAYVADGYKGLWIIDISDPKNPKSMGNYSCNAENVFVSGDYAYIANYSAGLLIINISNPKLPVFADSCGLSGSTKDIFVFGDYAYTANSDSKLNVINIRDPKNSYLMGSFNAASGPLYGVYVCGKYAYIVLKEGLQIVDITQPNNPVLVGSCSTPDIAYDIFVSGYYAYIADYRKGVQIIDIRNPSAPVLAGNYDTLGEASAVYVSGNAVYVTNDPAGLYILDMAQKVVSPVSKHWRIRLGVMDRDKNESQAVRDVWVNTYNHPPVLEQIKINVLEEPQLAASVVKSYDTPGSAVDVSVAGDYAYVADAANGLEIINIKQPDNPILTGSCDTPGEASGVYISGNYVYIADGSKGLQVIDITNPDRPVLAGGYDTLGDASAIYVSGNYAYIADSFKGLQIIDIKNPRFPILTSSVNNIGFAHDVYVLGNYAYIGTHSNGLQIVDVTNPAVPKLAGNYNAQGDIEGIYVLGKYAYAADYSQGLQIIDISEPKFPVLTGSCVTGGHPRNVYVSGKYAYVADGIIGLDIVDISEPRTPFSVVKCQMPLNDQANAVYVSGNFVYIADFRLLEIIQFIQFAGTKAEAIAGDPDLNTAWDGLSEYRWDFNNDNIWDTEFLSDKSVLFPSDRGSELVCEARDRFGAVSRMAASLPSAPVDTIPPVIINQTAVSQSLPLTFTAKVSDADSGVKDVYLEIEQGSEKTSYSMREGTAGLYSIGFSSVSFSQIRLFLNMYRNVYPFWIKYKIIALDNAGNQSASDGYSLSVINKVPIALIRVNRISGKTPLSVSFYADGCYDSDGKIVSYFWDFGNGKTSSQMNPICTFCNSSWRNNKDYSVSLTIKDNLGASSTARVKITVKPWWGRFWG
ncbi:MAG: PKD domain-containing protein [Candidatus Omnitrophota bacterium]